MVLWNQGTKAGDGTVSVLKREEVVHLSLVRLYGLEESVMEARVLYRGSIQGFIHWADVDVMIVVSRHGTRCSGNQKIKAM